MENKGIYINDTYYEYDEYENLDYDDENDYGQWNDDYFDDYDDYYDDKYYSAKHQSINSKGNKTIKKIEIDKKEEVRKKPLVITDVSKITAKKLPSLRIEYKQDTRLLVTNKEKEETKNNNQKESKKVYYAVRNGKKAGIYESLEKAQKQVKGVSGSEWKKFKTLEEANKYLEEVKVYKGKCYVVAKGRKPGIYKDYDLAKKQIDGYSCAYMKRFNSVEKAKEYINENEELSDLQYIDFGKDEKFLKIYTDGSYCEDTKKYGAAFVVIEDNEEIYRYSYAERDLTGKKNISGEIVAVIRALEWAFITKYSHNIEINYDLSYIKDICMNRRKSKIEYSKILREMYVMCISEGIDVRFKEIESHSGNYWNNLADKLAKKAAKVEDNEELLYFKKVEEKKLHICDGKNIANSIIENRKNARNKKKLFDRRIKPICVSKPIGFIDRVKNIFNGKR